MKKLETIRKYARKGCQILMYGLVTSLSYLSVRDILDIAQSSGDVGYGDAVNAIMSSDMWSADKNKAVMVLSKEENSEFYKAVIHIANSDMWSADKVRAIKNMRQPNE